MDNHPAPEELAAARAYEALHVPALFRQFCDPVLSAAGVNAGDRVLDVACGTGVLARAAAARVGPDGSVAGLDALPGMLAVAREQAPAIDWHHGLAEALPFADESFDAVVSQFGMMFFRDRVQAVREMLRVLAPDGRFAVAVWDALERSEAYPEEVELLQRRAGSAAADALRAPFVLGERAALAAIFEEAGVADIEIRTHHGTARFPGVRTLVEADLRGWLPVMGVNLDEELIVALLEEAEQALSAYVTGSGTVEFDAPAHIVSGAKAAA